MSQILLPGINVPCAVMGGSGNGLIFDEAELFRSDLEAQEECGTRNKEK